MFRKLTRPELLAIAILIAVTGTVAWPTAEAQFGGLDDPLDTSKYLPHGAIATGELIIFRSQSGNSLYGYANATGEFDNASFAPHPDSGYTPIVTARVAIVPGERKLFAFSANIGRWSTLEVDEAVDVSKVVVDQERATYLLDNEFHVFSNASGKWASVDLTKD
jgi:hypothetical protein